MALCTFLCPEEVQGKRNRLRPILFLQGWVGSGAGLTILASCLATASSELLDELGELCFLADPFLVGFLIWATWVVIAGHLGRLYLVSLHQLLDGGRLATGGLGGTTIGLSSHRSTVITHFSSLRSPLERSCASRDDLTLTEGDA